MLCKERLEKNFEKCFPTVIEKWLLGTKVQIQHQTIILREDFWAYIPFHVAMAKRDLE